MYGVVGTTVGCIYASALVVVKRTWSYKLWQYVSSIRFDFLFRPESCMITARARVMTEEFFQGKALRIRRYLSSVIIDMPQYQYIQYQPDGSSRLSTRVSAYLCQRNDSCSRHRNQLMTPLTLLHSGLHDGFTPRCLIDTDGCLVVRLWVLMARHSLHNALARLCLSTGSSSSPPCFKNLSSSSNTIIEV